MPTVMEYISPSIKGISSISQKIRYVLVLALVMSFVYCFIMFADSDSYNNNPDDEDDGFISKVWNRWTDALYFSLISATTVGFGDITPQKNFPKWLSIVHTTLNLIIVSL